MIIKSFISVEGLLNQSIKKFSCHRTNCFELFGFDILIDSELKPWLMEINLTPSLACESPLDFQIKSTLIADMFTLIGIQPFDRKRDGAFSKPKSTGPHLLGQKDPLRALLPLTNISENPEHDEITNTVVFARLKVF